ncbi:MAG: VWA domain-containing protein [Polyangiaceae bacterium]
MGFAAAIGLFVAALVALPYFAHRLKRRHAEERAFAPLRLVPPLLPKARRRAEIEDRSLLSLRLLAVVALAILGATPLMRCSRVSLARGGASVAVAIVLDDSMSMRARGPDGTRFARAKRGAEELIGSLREGDSVTIILAGAPARIALAPTVDLTAARAALSASEESDRGTDLEGALELASSLARKLPHVDKRAVVFSDRADGNPTGSPFVAKDLVTWFPMPDLAGPSSDCAVLEATRVAAFVRVSVACSDATVLGGRMIELLSDGKVVAKSEALEKAQTHVRTIAVPPEATGDLVVRLIPSPTSSGAPIDAIASDDVAPVVPEGTKDGIAVLSPRRDEALATGGPPVVEQAFAALKLPMSVRPMPIMPDTTDDLTPYAGIVLDDPQGLTPEQRRALEGFFRGGGIVLLTLGPGAASAQIGASFSPILSQAPSFRPSPAKGLDTTSLPPEFSNTEGLTDLAAKAHTVLGPDDLATFSVAAKWDDGTPFFLRRPVFLGEAWVLSLPFSLDHSDLALRAAMLDLLEAFANEARARTAPRRTEAGTSWLLRGAKVRARGPIVELKSAGAPTKNDAPELSVTPEPNGVSRVTPGVIGSYVILADDRQERRVVAPVPKEVDFRPRPLSVGASESNAKEASGPPSSLVDISWVFALLVLVIFFLELAYRTLLWWQRNTELPPESVGRRAG